MADNVTIGIRLTADGKELVGAVQLSSAELEKLAAATRKAGGEADQFSAKQASMSANIRSVARDLVGYWAAWKIGESVKDMALLNARYETLGISMTMVGKNSGYTSQQMEDAAQSMQATGISMVESRQQAMRLVQAHIDLAQSTKLARIAQDAAVIGNMNSSEAFANMIHGIQTGQTDVLRTIGLNVSMEQSYKLMAQQLHKNVDALTQTEKTQAILNAVVLAGADIAGTYEAAMGTAGKQINSMTRYTEDLRVKQGEVFNELLTVAVMAFTEHLKSANGEIDEMAKNGELAAWGATITEMFAGLADNVSNFAGAVQIVGKTLAYFAASGSTVMNREQLQAMNDAYGKDIADILAKEDRFSRALDERRRAQAEKHSADEASVRAHNERITSIMQFYTGLRVKGLMTEAAYLKKVSSIQQQDVGDHHQYKDQPVAAKDTAAESAIKHAQDFIKHLKLQDEQLGLDESQKKAVEAATIALSVKSEALRMKIMESVGAFGAHVGAQQVEIAAEKKQAEAVDALNKRYDEAEMAKSDAIKSTNDYVKSLEQANKQRDFELSLMGMSEEARQTAIGQYQIEIGQYQIEKELQDQILKIKIATKDEDERARQIAVAKDAAAGAKQNLAQYTRIQETQKEWQKVFTSMESIGKQAFVNIFARDGKSAVESLHKAIQASLVDLLYELTMKKWIIQLEASITGTGGINGAGGGGGGGLGSLINAGISWLTGGSGGAGSMNSGGSVQGNADYFYDLHSGGIVGSGEGSGLNLRPMSLFSGAPKYHSGGLAGDEIPTVLQRGEGVFTPGQMRMLAPAGQASAAPNVVVQVINQSGQAVSAKQKGGPQFDGRDWVIGVVLDAADNNPSFRAAMGLGR